MELELQPSRHFSLEPATTAATPVRVFTLAVDFWLGTLIGTLSVGISAGACSRLGWSSLRRTKSGISRNFWEHARRLKIREPPFHAERSRLRPISSSRFYRFLAISAPPELPEIQAFLIFVQKILNFLGNLPIFQEKIVFFPQKDPPQENFLSVSRISRKKVFTGRFFP